MELEHLLGIVLPNGPECDVEEYERFQLSNGDEVIDYRGSDGCQYVLTKHKSGAGIWKRFPPPDDLDD